MSYVNTIRMFVRVYELGSMRPPPPAISAPRLRLPRPGFRSWKSTSACACSAAPPAACNRPRMAASYDGAKKVLEAIDDAEAAVMDVTQNPRGTIHVSAPLGIGRRFIAPHVPEFKDIYPQIDVRLRLSDRIVDVTTEGLDVAFHLGILEDSTLKVRQIADCPRILCAAPVARRGNPADGAALVDDRHDCLNLRFPARKSSSGRCRPPGARAAMKSVGRSKAMMVMC